MGLPDLLSKDKAKADKLPPLLHAAELIKSGKAKKVAVLAGAGISTSAGIPDFRSPGTGLYDNLQALDLPYPEAVFDVNYFEVRPEPFWTLAKDLYPGKYYPTPTHYFLALLHARGVLQRVWTQNIDTLETAAGVPEDLVLEAHGSFRNAHCLRCSRPSSTEHVVSSGVRHGHVVRCSHNSCNGLVKPDIVFFGEGLPDDFFRLQRELRDCDLLIVLGTSLQVMPFAGLVNAVGSDVPRVLINREAVGAFARLKHNKSKGRDHLYQGDTDEAARIIARELGWEEELDKLIEDGRKELEKTWKEREGLAKAKGEKGAKGTAGKKEEAKKAAETKAEDKVSPAAKKDDVQPAGKDKKDAKPDADKDVDALADAVAKVEVSPKPKV
ncbi:NAD-dependent protein deacetylase hst2 [Vanrija pseudolonga]|uniref:NAD-dependent protein deacetylase n=1 Tax=Vanrija pseudolonga TaxID=143232 RepID=A0AAF1BPV9_9TREE|nr:NAD-dependent protein deacetylase hst2 [Vanrija pseudolonga]